MNTNNSRTNKHEDMYEQLLSDIEWFMHHTTLKSKDAIILTKLIQELKRNGIRISRKVLRSIRNKYETIQNNYQR